jgi:hypothetical protein
MSKEVVTQESALPALVNPQALGNLDGRDVSLPRLYKGEYQSSLVQDDTVPKGSTYVAAGPDDPDPEVVTTTVGDKVLVHVLRAWKGKSANLDDNGNVVKSGGTFTTWKYEDANAPDGANVDYHYVVSLPDVDPDIPVKLTFAKTSVPAGKKINFLLLKDPSLAPYTFAFELNTKHREKKGDGQTYRWYIWEARLVEAKPANVESAAKLSELVNAVPADIERTSGPGNEPQI